MQVVALHLRDHARQQTIPVADRDCFGRSAFNRFYYAAYLGVRTELRGTISNWPDQHGAIPGFLKATVTRSIQAGSRVAGKAGDQELVALCGRAKAAAAELSSLLANAYGSRVTADYHPEVAIVFPVNGDFSLQSVAIEQAKTWPYKAVALASVIANAWRQIHG
jgi:hypothetical protein